MIDKVATYKEKTESMKAKVKKAMMYPLMVMIAAVVVSTIMLIWVIPTFKDIFEGFGQIFLGLRYGLLVCLSGCKLIGSGH